ncbi:hypothetical protein RHGRI_011533 [Rhododendron griersonianum]|uniref:Uncharacterized protein n=1 Tax=Rhododendron griersonianum TaxID=479676 RepID=A0AAV6KMM2_9ERIC|nr:hypothetical protein RHGRI_011533 [Rhododendron griersonianum]
MTDGSKNTGVGESSVGASVIKPELSPLVPGGKVRWDELVQYDSVSDFEATADVAILNTSPLPSLLDTFAIVDGDERTPELVYRRCPHIPKQESPLNKAKIIRSISHFVHVARTRWSIVDGAWQKNHLWSGVGFTASHPDGTAIPQIAIRVRKSLSQGEFQGTMEMRRNGGVVDDEELVVEE